MTELTRQLAKEILGQYLTKEKNIEILEKNIYLSLEDQEYETEQELDKNYNTVLYQVIGDIISEKNIKDVLSELKQGKVLWNHPEYDQLKIEMEEQDRFAENPIEIVEGIEDCKKCGSNKVSSYSVQTRSADEGMTTFCTCLSCNARWSHRG